eukprot:1547482-Prymnesium_polylepis.1
MHTLTEVLFTLPSTVAVSTVDEQSPTTRSVKAPADPADETAVQLDESDHDTRESGTACCSMWPSEKRASIRSESDAVCGAPTHLPVTSPSMRARQLDDVGMLREALTTSGTSMKAATAPVIDGHCAHATIATSPQKYCGSGWTTS